jgi:hypothetical protein
LGVIRDSYEENVTSGIFLYSVNFPPKLKLLEADDPILLQKAKINQEIISAHHTPSGPVANLEIFYRSKIRSIAACH